MTKIERLWEQRAHVQRKIANLKADIDDIDNELFALIPEGEARDGVRHIVTNPKTVSYARAFTVAKQLLTPKPRKLVERLIGDFTSYSDPRHSLKATSKTS